MVTAFGPRRSRCGKLAAYTSGGFARLADGRRPRVVHGRGAAPSYPCRASCVADAAPSNSGDGAAQPGQGRRRERYVSPKEPSASVFARSEASPGGARNSAAPLGAGRRGGGPALLPLPRTTDAQGPPTSRAYASPAL